MKTINQRLAVGMLLALMNPKDFKTKGRAIFSDSEFKEINKFLSKKPRSSKSKAKASK
jgi:hypothetical protein